MYIIFETVASNDPRLDPRMNVFGKFWHYSVAYIAEEHESSVVTSWLNGEVVTKKVAQSDKFCTACNGELSVVRADFGTYDELTSPTSFGDNNYRKQTYFLNEDNIASTTEFLKAVMRLQIQNHLKESDNPDNASNPTGTARKLKIKVEQVTNVNEAQELMSNYFDLGFAYTEGMPRTPEFPVIWS